MFFLEILTQVLLNPDIPRLCKQCRARSAGFWRNQLVRICTINFVIKYVNLYQQTGSSNLIGWKSKSGHGLFIYSVWQGLIKTGWAHVWTHQVWNRNGGFLLTVLHTHILVINIKSNRYCIWLNYSTTHIHVGFSKFVLEKLEVKYTPTSL